MMYAHTGQNNSKNMSYLEMMKLSSNILLKNSNIKENENDCNVIIKKRKIRNKFTPEEDQKLRELIQKHGEHSWNLVSSLMETRNQRQCRERWKHYLSCDMNQASKPWTKEEDELIINKFNELGGKWTKIARELPGRSDLQVKIRYLKHLKNKKNRNKYKRDESESSDEYYPDEEDDEEEIDTKKSSKDTKKEINEFELKELQPQTIHNDEQREEINEPYNADTIFSETNFSNDLGFNLNFDLPSTNILTEICQCNENNLLCQIFEPDYLNWSFE